MSTINNKNPSDYILPSNIIKYIDTKIEEKVNKTELDKFKSIIVSLKKQIDSIIDDKSSINNISSKLGEFTTSLDTIIGNMGSINTELEKISSNDAKYDELNECVLKLQTKIANSPGSISFKNQEIMNELLRLIDTKSNISDVDNKFSEFISNMDNIVKPIIDNELKEINKILPTLITNKQFEKKIKEIKNSIKILPKSNDLNLDKIPLLESNIESVNKKFDDMTNLFKIIENKIEKTQDIPQEIYNKFHEIIELVNTKSNMIDVEEKFMKFSDMIDYKFEEMISKELSQINTLIPSLVQKMI